MSKIQNIQDITAMQMSKMMRHGRERTDGNRQVKGKWSHWFLLFISSRKIQHSRVSSSLKAPRTLCCYVLKKFIFKLILILKLPMPDLISFQYTNWTGIENLHVLSKTWHLIIALTVAMAKASPKGVVEHHTKGEFFSSFHIRIFIPQTF